MFLNFVKLVDYNIILMYVYQLSYMCTVYAVLYIHKIYVDDGMDTYISRIGCSRNISPKFPVSQLERGTLRPSPLQIDFLNYYFFNI